MSESEKVAAEIAAAKAEGAAAEAQPQHLVQLDTTGVKLDALPEPAPQLEGKLQGSRSEHGSPPAA